MLAGEAVDGAAVHVSEFKAMLNRCIRKDQPDWRSVFDLLERPPFHMLRRGVLACEALRADPGADLDPDDAAALGAMAKRAQQRLRG